LILCSLETYNLHSIASQLKRLFDPLTIGISPEVDGVSASSAFARGSRLNKRSNGVKGCELDIERAPIIHRRQQL